MPSYVWAIASTNASSPTSASGRKVSDVGGSRGLRRRGRVPPAQAVAQELVAGLLEQADAGVLVLLVLRLPRRVVDVVAERPGAERAGQLVRLREHCMCTCQIGLVPVGVDEDKVGGRRLVGYRPQRGPRDGDVPVQADDAPVRPGAAALEQRRRVVAQLGLELRSGRDGQEGVQRRLFHGDEVEHGGQLASCRGHVP